MRWRHKSSSIVISIFFSRVSRIGQKTYGFTSCVQRYLKTYSESTNSFPDDDNFQQESYPCKHKHFFINTNL